jgi:hypothetical protein
VEFIYLGLKRELPLGRWEIRPVMSTTDKSTAVGIEDKNQSQQGQTKKMLTMDLFHSTKYKYI